MGVKGLQGFMELCCPEACVTVNLRDMATRLVASRPASSPGPTLVVDGMACLRHWYSCKDWLCGGQWKEYLDVLKRWCEAFTSTGIRLVFFFDGVVEEQKRDEWVKRRHRVNRDISKIFCHVKTHGEHPGRELFCLPSGLATFTCFALRSLGQEVFCSVQEADYEIANYARQHGCMGILGQDSDFIIYDSAPYFSVAKLQKNILTTVLYDRQRLCQAIGLTVSQLPLLACLLGNDVVSEEQMHHIRNNAMATYRKNNPAPHSGAHRGQMVLAVAQLVSSLWDRQVEDIGNILQPLNLSPRHKELLKRGSSPTHFLDRKLLSEMKFLHTLATLPLRTTLVQRYQSVLCEGVIECSNTLEDGEDTELLPQALVYRRCRQHIYGFLLGYDGSTVTPPAVREWFVYPGNPLKEPDMVHPVPLSLPYDCPSLDLLWFGTCPEVSTLRLASFFAIFDCQEFSELYGAIEDSLLVALCLVTYIVLQVQTLSQEDVDAYLSQCVSLTIKSTRELQQIQLPFISSRAVQLGSLYVRGLSHLLGANCASGCPLPNAAMMPWHSFDGLLFHSKYLLAHSGTEKAILLDNDSTRLSLFLRLRERLIESCRKRGRVLQSRPRPNAPVQSHKSTLAPGYGDRHAGCPLGGGKGWRERGEETGSPQHGGGWRERGQERRDSAEYENRDRQWERGHRRGMRGGPNFTPRSFPDYHGRGPQDTSRPPTRSYPRVSRGRYQLAPRWSQPPAPGT